MVREFIKQIAFLCNAEQPERFSDMMLMVYDKELEDHNSVYARKDYDKKDERARLNVLFNGLRGDKGKIRYCQDLLYLTQLCGYREKWAGNRFDNDIHSMQIALSAVEPDYSEVSKVYSVETALLAWWLT